MLKTRFHDSIKLTSNLYQSGGEIAKASVLASSSDEGTVSSDGSVPLQTKDKKEKEKRSENGSTDKKSAGFATKRPALLNMKLSENDTSEDEAKSRYNLTMEKSYQWFDLMPLRA